MTTQYDKIIRDKKSESSALFNAWLNLDTIAHNHRLDGVSYGSQERNAAAQAAYEAYETAQADYVLWQTVFGDLEHYESISHGLISHAGNIEAEDVL